MVILGQEYVVADADKFPIGTGEPETIVPIGYDDIGNLRVDQYYADDTQKTILWDDDAIDDLIDETVLVERGKWSDG